MAKKGNLNTPTKTKPGKSGAKSTPGKVKIGAAAGLETIRQIMANPNMSIDEAKAKVTGQSGFVNPPATPASAPSPIASAPQPGGFVAPPPSHFQAGMAAALNAPQPLPTNEMYGRQMDAAAKILNGEPDRPAWKTEGYAPTSGWSEGARAAGRAYDRMRDEKIYRADVDESYKQAKVMDKAWSRNRHAEVQAQRQADREEDALQAEAARRGGGRDDGNIDVTTGSFNAGFNAYQIMKELADKARGRQTSFFAGHRDATVIRRGLIAAMEIASEMKPINDAAHQLEPFLKFAEYAGYVGGPWTRLAVFAATSVARGVAAYRESQVEAVQSKIDVQRALYSANDPMAESFAVDTRGRALKALGGIDRALYNVGFENILEADIKKQTSERIEAYNSTKGELAAYGIDFSQIVAKYAADKGIPVGQVTEREQNELLSQTLENQVRPMVGDGRAALYDKNEVEEMIPFWTSYGGDSKAVRETMKQKYFNLALEGKTKYGDKQTDFRASQDNQRKWWNNNSPEFRRKFDIDSRESQQQAKAIRKRHTQGF